MSRSAAIFLAVVMTLAASWAAADDEGRFDPTVFVREPLPTYTAFAKFFQFQDGQAWAVAAQQPSQLWVRDNGRWQLAADWGWDAEKAETRGLFVEQAMAAGDGLWFLARQHGEKFLVIKWNRLARRVDFYKTLPFEKIDIRAARLQIAPDGSLWVTANDPRVFRLADGEDEWREMFRVENAMTLKPLPEGKEHRWDRLELAFDASGAAWIWTKRGLSLNEEGTLRGLARVRDGKSQWFESIGGLPAGALLMMKLVTVSGRQELWATVQYEGAFRIQLEPLSASRLDFPADTKKNPLWEVFEENGKIWAVSQSGSFNAEVAGDTNETLWCRNTDGGWEKKIEGLDLTPPWYDSERPRLSAGHGFWLASHGRGLWWIPADGEPVCLDWTKGFPVSRPCGLLADGKGTLTVTGGNMGQLFHFEIARALALPATTPASIVAFAGNEVTQARDGSLFMCSRYARVLRQWTRAGWRDIPLGDDLETDRKFPPDVSIGADSLNRVWIIPDVPDRHLTRVWNINSQTWDAPRPYLELIAEAAQASPDWHFLFNVLAPGHLPYRREAVFDRHGRAAFIRHSVLWFYDGRRWSQLAAKDFSPKEYFRELQNDAADGGILVLLGEKNWHRLDRENKWVALDDTEKPRSRQTLTEPLAKDQNFKRPKEWEWLAVDGFVTADHDEWLTVDGMLCRRRGNNLVTWFEPGQPNPFLIGFTGMERTMMDSFGRRLFFGYNMVAVAGEPSAGGRWVNVSVSVEHPAHDAARLRFDSLTAGELSLRWRLAAGKWSEWTRDDLLNFSALPPGEYTVQYELMNKWLEVSPPAAVKFTIKYDVDKIVREAAEQLFSKNWEERNAAVKTLARFPEQARAALQQVAADRQRLGDSDRWWLDAALEQLGGR